MKSKLVRVASNQEMEPEITSYLRGLTGLPLPSDFEFPITVPDPYNTMEPKFYCQKIIPTKLALLTRIKEELADEKAGIKKQGIKSGHSAEWMDQKSDALIFMASNKIGNIISECHTAKHISFELPACKAGCVIPAFMKTGEKADYVLGPSGLCHCASIKK